MGARDRYVALVASLPSSERLFFAKQPPLSRLRLDKRLRALTEEDAASLAALERVMSWGAYELSTTAEDVLARADRALAEIPQPTLAALVRERLEMRAGVAALRLRAQSVDASAAAARLGRWGRRFVDGWSDPLFKLGRRSPWIAKARALIEAGDPLGLERQILEVTHRQLQRSGARHQFDFEAVAIYVLKWSIFDRWARANVDAAARRFEALADAALVDFPELRNHGGADVAA